MKAKKIFLISKLLKGYHKHDGLHHCFQPWQLNICRLQLPEFPCHHIDWRILGVEAPTSYSCQDWETQERRKYQTEFVFELKFELWEMKEMDIWEHNIATQECFSLLEVAWITCFKKYSEIKDCFVLTNHFVSAQAFIISITQLCFPSVLNSSDHTMQLSCFAAAMVS